MTAHQSISDSLLRPGEILLGPASLQVGVSARVPPAMRSYTREIADVEVEPESRGQGFARALLAEVISIADREGLALILEVGAGPGSTLDDAALASWYGRLGFVTLQMPRPGSRRVMVRLVAGMIPKRIHYNAAGVATQFEPPDLETANVAGATVH